jgi:hypothetical protein
MNRNELVNLIKNFKERYTDRQSIETMLMFQGMNLNQANHDRAINLILEGIDIYKQYNDYKESIQKLNQAIVISPSATAYFNRGTIHWCEHDYFNSFKDHCSSLILDTENYPLSYFYLAHSTYEITGKSEPSSISDELFILNFVVEMLQEGAERKEPNAIQMLDHAIGHRDFIKEKLA